MQQIAIERQLFDVSMGFVEQRHSGRFVNSAALHSHKAILDHIQSANAVSTTDFVQFEHHCQWADTKNGYVVEPDDEAAVAEKAIYLFTHPAVAKKLGAGARAYAENFSETHIAEEWEEIYKKTINDYNKEKHPR